MAITHVERGVLKILAEAGGRHTFRPDASDQAAYGVFDRDVVRTLYSLKAKGYVSIDEGASRPISMPGQEGKFATIVAELTETGRQWTR